MVKRKSVKAGKGKTKARRKIARSPSPPFDSESGAEQAERVAALEATVTNEDAPPEVPEDYDEPQEEA
jgi:hypothetical protein